MSLTQFRNSTPQSLRNLPENVSNRAYVVAFAVKEAFAISKLGNRNSSGSGSNHDWNIACQTILDNRLLTTSEKTTILSLLR
ncbi:3688_t:CDS:2 [Cetraspora pellucida]|uniref:3688_t:CDS:1 n=1 Tax=Cetraspora pellucida TaxID=1433469 RepID=A0A9N9JZ30_9GLOM|nr:3688_t:CDS:2 [Cetraspora pellucida]